MHSAQPRIISSAILFPPAFFVMLARSPVSGWSDQCCPVLGRSGRPLRAKRQHQFGWRQARVRLNAAPCELIGTIPHLRTHNGHGEREPAAAASLHAGDGAAQGASRSGRLEHEVRLDLTATTADPATRPCAAAAAAAAGTTAASARQASPQLRLPITLETQTEWRWHTQRTQSGATEPSSSRGGRRCGRCAFDSELFSVWPLGCCSDATVSAEQLPASSRVVDQQLSKLMLRNMLQRGRRQRRWPGASAVPAPHHRQVAAAASAGRNSSVRTCHSLQFLRRKWEREQGYVLRKYLFAFQVGRKQAMCLLLL